MSVSCVLIIHSLLFRKWCGGAAGSLATSMTQGLFLSSGDCLSEVTVNVVCEFPPSSQKPTRRWIYSDKLCLGVNECLYDALLWTGSQSRVCSCLTPRVPGTGSKSIATKSGSSSYWKWILFSDYFTLVCTWKHWIQSQYCELWGLGNYCTHNHKLIHIGANFSIVNPS